MTVKSCSPFGNAIVPLGSDRNPVFFVADR